MKDERVHYVSFQKLWKESALYAGLQLSTGDYVATLDVDLQDPPSLLPKCGKQSKSQKVKEDYDCICETRELTEQEPPIRSFFARMFYKIINKMSSTEIVDGARRLRLMKRKMVDASFGDAGECNRFTKEFCWVRVFHTKWIAFGNVERSARETKWMLSGNCFYIRLKEFL